MRLSASSVMRATCIAVTLLTASTAGFYPHGSAAASQFSPAPAIAQNARYYAQTGHSVGGAFLSFFDRYGGVAIFGYPISDEISENGRTVQYFERERFEYHPEYAGTQYEVLLGCLSAELGQARVSFARIAPFASTAGRAYVPETGHSLGSPFLAFWRANGGIPVFGYPVSEPTRLNGLLVQYFERARMEYHPELAGAGYAVELGQLGTEYLQAHPAIARIAQSSARVPVPALITGRENTLFTLLNQARQAAGLRPVTLDPAITGLARSRSNDMATRNYFAHVTPEGTNFLDMLKARTISYKWAGEVIQMNNYRVDLSVNQAYQGWMNSPEHHAIIMDPRYNLVGVAEAAGSNGFHYYTAIFVQR